jgi:hypothetical protein
MKGGTFVLSATLGTIGALLVCDAAAGARTPTDPDTGLYATVNTLAPRTFYPYVRDGYRDRVRINVGTQYDAPITEPCYSDTSEYTATVVIRNGRGQPLRHFTKTNDFGFFSFLWDSRTYSGRRAAVGSYHVTLSLNVTCDRTDDSGVVNVPLHYDGSEVKTTVARGYRWVNRAATRWGRWVSSSSASGSCSSHPNNNGWLLDCDGVSGSASASWTIALQAPYRRVSISFPDSLHAGPANTSANRSTRSVRVNVSIPGYAWAYVDRIRVTYQARKRI